jgi:phosphonate transport system permease protein
MRKIKPFLIDSIIWAYASIAFYKVIFQKLILDARYSNFYWSEILFVSLIGTAIAFILFQIPRFSIGNVICQNIQDKQPYISPLKRPYAFVALLVIIITFITGFHISQVSFKEFFSSSGIEGAKRIFFALFSPNFDILEAGLFSAIETLYMAFIATSLAIPFAFIISFFAAKNIMNKSLQSKIVYNICRFLLNSTRSIEPLVWAIIFSVWVGIGPFSGMLALCIHSIASLAKLYSEQIENIDNGPVEAITSTGAHPIQIIWFGVVPQVLLPFLSFTIYRWDINVRMATIIGLVGGGGIGTMLMQYQGTARWNEVGLLVIIIGIIVGLMDWASSKIRERIK